MAYLCSDVLTLRAPEWGDLDYLFHVENDTRQWMVSACKVPYSRFQLQQYIETNAHDIYVDKQLRLMVELVEDKRLVGIIDFFDFSPADHRAEVGIIIDHDSRGRGYGQEALALLSPVDIVLVEGYKSEEGLPRILVHRSGLSTDPLTYLTSEVVAIATDDAQLTMPAGVQRLDLNNPGAVANFIVGLKANCDHI
jgi:hypothetical protein